MNKIKKIYRDSQDRMIAGVCSGFGQYLNIDAALIRLLLVSSVLIAGFGVLAYIIAWIIIPERQNNSL